MRLTINVDKYKIQKKYSNKGYSKCKDINLLNDLELNTRNNWRILIKNKPDLMLLTNVEATILTKNSEPIKIYSKKSLYNNLNYNTNFYDECRLSTKSQFFQIILT